MNYITPKQRLEKIKQALFKVTPEVAEKIWRILDKYSDSEIDKAIAEIQAEPDIPDEVKNSI